MVGGGGGGGGRWLSGRVREIERERDRQTDRQTDRHREREWGQREVTTSDIEK